MKRRPIPDAVSRQIDRFEQAVEHLTERLARTERHHKRARKIDRWI